jgi:hypothetical protein
MNLYLVRCTLQHCVYRVATAVSLHAHLFGGAPITTLAPTIGVLALSEGRTDLYFVMHSHTCFTNSYINMDTAVQYTTAVEQAQHSLPLRKKKARRPVPWKKCK